MLQVNLALEELRELALSNKFFSYIAGAVHMVLDKYSSNINFGLRIHSLMSLPMKKGLASSAAISVLVVRAFNKMFNLDLDPRQEMELAFQGEALTHSQCGRMDQVCALGRVLSVLTFTGDQLQIELHQIKNPIRLVLVDLKSSKNTRRILEALRVSYCIKNEGILDALGPSNWRITSEAILALLDGDCERVGSLMGEAQQIFDMKVAPLCELELTAPKLHKVLKLVEPLIYGGKGVGSQGEGTLQLVARGPLEQEQIVSSLVTEDVTCYPITLGGKEV